jgi:predicted lipoprotein with Yx(FWY)xxD motif
MKAAVDAKTFADSKMTTAKQATKNKCLTCDQIKALMLLFTFEDDKLEFAQYAYDNCADRDNYYLLYDAFEFESSIDELNEYIEMR